MRLYIFRNDIKNYIIFLKMNYIDQNSVYDFKYSTIQKNLAKYGEVQLIKKI